MEKQDLENRFTYHAPDEEQKVKIELIREEALKWAKDLNVRCPDSREKSLAMTALEAVVSHMVAAIVRNPQT